MNRIFTEISGLNVKPTHRLTYQFCSLFCFFAATFLSAVLCFVGNVSEKRFLFALIFGFIIDIFRWNFAPELKISAYERQSSFQRALEDKSYSSLFRTKFWIFTGSIYYFWWLIFLVVVFVPHLYLSTIIHFCHTYYPFLGNRDLAVKTFGTPDRATIALNTLSLAWIFTVITAISEISCGAFNDLHNPIRSVITGKKILLGNSRLQFVRFFALLFCVSVAYCMIAFTFEYRTGVSSENAPIGSYHPLPLFSFYYILLINASCLVGTSGCIRHIYAFVLLQTTKVRPT